MFSTCGRTAFTPKCSRLKAVAAVRTNPGCRVGRLAGICSDLSHPDGCHTKPRRSMKNGSAWLGMSLFLRAAASNPARDTKRRKNGRAILSAAWYQSQRVGSRRCMAMGAHCLTQESEITIKPVIGLYGRRYQAGWCPGDTALFRRYLINPTPALPRASNVRLTGSGTGCPTRNSNAGLPLLSDA